MFSFSFLILVSLSTVAKTVPQARSSDCVGTISSLNDVDSAVQCKTVNINAFTMPGGKTFTLDLLEGTTVNVLGDIHFETNDWSGPLLEVKGTDITFNGNGKTWDGRGPYYWYRHKLFAKTPSPMMRFEASGMVSDIHVINSPAKCFATYAYNGPLVISGVNIDNSQGDGVAKNTDGFDITGNNIVVQKSTVVNQDVCVAIARGQNIVFQDNHCEGGYGICIGSIGADTTVGNVTIQGNTVVNSRQGFSIRTDAHLKGPISSVAHVTYSNNVAKNCLSYGLLITQSWPEFFGTPGDRVIISDINFDQGTTDIDVGSSAITVAVDCAPGSCVGPWNWSGLKVSGGTMGQLENVPAITGFGS